MDHTSIVNGNHELTDIKQDAYCDFCWSTEPIAYWHCTICSMHLCKDCITLPQETSHWLHPQHPLRMNNTCSPTWSNQFEERGICEGCNLFLGYHRCYKCSQCEFRICVQCCTSTTSKRPLQWKNNKLSHYSHVHKLTRCRFREEVASTRCWICKLKMWGIGYACVGCYYFLHESCIEASQVVQHPFHPQHPLRRLDYKSLDASEVFCNICGRLYNYRDDGLYCLDCKFYLHIRCADYVLRVIKLDCHAHGLLFFQTMAPSKPPGNKCHICGMDFAADRGYYVFRCVECSRNFHFDCVSIPQNLKHGHHQHTLTLTDPCDDNISDEYYCDICEARRDPKCYAYRCEQCNFFAHMECLFSKKEGLPQFLLSLEAKHLNKTELQKPPNDSTNKQFQQACHSHPLYLKNGTNRRCCMCELKINDQAYACEKCDEEFWVHEKCGELPENLDHPLHPSHNLSLLKNCQSNGHGYFICSLCSEITLGFNFSCRTCDFVIDIRCALTIKSEQPFDKKEYRKSLRHLVHVHELTLANTRGDIELVVCGICGKRCSGLTYCCRECYFFAHKACVEWASEVEPHPLHPEHRLRLSSFKYGSFEDDDKCYACDGLINSLGYECEKYRGLNWKCKVVFHLECGISLARLLKQKHHHHYFYYFHKLPLIGHFYSDGKVCSVCQKEADGSYYSCLKCKSCFHLRCLQLPQTAKHKWHLHYLTFKDSIDYGGYYCDICEEPRDLQHPVYCCEECDFVAHVECIVSKENASSITLKEIQIDRDNIPECSQVSPSSASTSD